MARRISPSQLRSQLRRAQSQMRHAQQRRKQAVDRFNRAVRDLDRKTRQAVNDYNREVRAHNARVRANRRRLEQELAQLQRPSLARCSTRVTLSARNLQKAFVRVAERRQAGVGYSEHLYALFEGEAANSLRVANAMEGHEDADQGEIARLQSTTLSGELQAFSTELEERWKGALFALNPSNPDAARHFCTSARECIVAILDGVAPDKVVEGHLTNCTRTGDGRLTRRSKLRYLLVRKGLVDDAVEAFIHEDVEDILALLGDLNKATHGTAGRFDLNQLVAVKQRTESGIKFLYELSRQGPGVD